MLIDTVLDGVDFESRFGFGHKKEHFLANHIVVRG